MSVIAILRQFDLLFGIVNGWETPVDVVKRSSDSDFLIPLKSFTFQDAIVRNNEVVGSIPTSSTILSNGFSAAHPASTLPTMRPGRPLADPSAVQPEDDAGGTKALDSSA